MAGHDPDTSEGTRKRERSAWRRLWVLWAAVLGAAAVGGLLVVLLTGAGGSGSREPAAPTARPTSTGRLPGLQSTPPPWRPEYESLLERLSALRFPPVGDESFHIHALVHVYVNGRRVSVPPNIGIGETPQGVVESPLHTHDSSGVVHVESDERFKFTLGMFFAIWGVTFTDRQLGDSVNRGARQVRVYVDGRPVQRSTRHLLEDQQNIVVAYGKPGSFPTRPDASALADA